MPPRVRILDATRAPAPRREDLAAAVSRGLGVEARSVPGRLDLERAWDPSRRQHDASALLGQVMGIAGAGGEKVIAVVEVDLFIPVLTFVFGQAQLDGPAGIVSTHRLANEFYGLERDDRLLRERIEKEVVHELGHMFGLYHCHQFECVMRSSTYVEEIDLKRADFCPSCAGLIRAKVGAIHG